MLFITMLRIGYKRMKRSYVLLFLTLVFCVAAMTVALLMVRSRKIQEADRTLQYYGNYDFAFCDVSEELESRVTQDGQFGDLEYVYDFGEFYFSESGNAIEVGALGSAEAENMFYVHPTEGRYPEKTGEICMDKIALKCNGYEEKLGQTITLFQQNESGVTEEREYTLVGMIELQKQDIGTVYSCRRYPEEMFSLNNVQEINFPFVYLSVQEMEQGMTCQKKHILANVSDKEKSDTVMDSYLYDDQGQLAVEGMHMAADRSFGREWTVICIIGNQLEDGTNAYVVRESMETGNVKEDAYTKIFIPIFMALLLIISVVGIYDAVILSMKERREVYGILLGLGMNGRRIVKYVFLEFALLLVGGIGVGWLAGIGIYQIILYGAQKLWEITIPSALAMDPYYAPFIKIVTRDPWIWSAVLAVVVAGVAVVRVAVDIHAMTPLALMTSAIYKRKRKKRTGNVYSVLNRYVGHEGRVKYWSLYIIVGIVMAVSVFGFCFFRGKAKFDTSEMTDILQKAQIGGMDYYMSQSDSVYSGNMQYMHDSGVTDEMYQRIQDNPLVKSIQGVVVNHQTALIYDRDNMLFNVLQPQSAYYEAMNDSTEEKIKVKASQKMYQMMGVDTARQEVFQVPTIGIQSDMAERFQESVIEGEIHPDKLQSGEEVLVVLTDETLANYFTVGEALPLYDFVRPAEIDNSQEWLLGLLPESHRSDPASYSVSVDGSTSEYWCYDSLQKISVRIGAVICIDPEEDSMFFDDGGWGYTVNIMTGMESFERWGLPNRNYTRVGVRLQDIHDAPEFEKDWMAVMQDAGYMNSIDTYSILQDKNRTQNQIMSIFYSVMLVLLLIGLLCIGNSIAMRIHHMEEEQKILSLQGMTKAKMLILYIRRFLVIGVAGICFSIVPAVIYSLLVRYASRMRTEAYYADTIDILDARHPWMGNIPKFDMLNSDLVMAVTLTGILMLVLLSVVVCMQSGWLRTVIQTEEQEG